MNEGSRMTQSLTLSGYQPYTEVMAQRALHGGGRSNFVISLPLHLISAYLPIPDPEQPFPGNRRVSLRHANQFGQYWRDNAKWVAPPLLVDTALPLAQDFDVKFEAGGIEFGILRLHHNASASFDILDGQHRILGWKNVADQISEDLRAAYSALQDADPDDLRRIAELKEQIGRIKQDQERLSRENITVEIMQGLNDEDHKQAFNDIATNALGITKSVTVGFDRRSMINRVAIELAEHHPLIEGRVEWEKDRVAGSNENLVSGKNLADIVRHVVVGIDGRMTSARERDFKENAVLDVAESFLNLLQSELPQFTSLNEEDTSVSELRSTDMIVSATVLRVLAGAFHDLAVDTSEYGRPFIDLQGRAKAARTFREIAQNTAFPLRDAWYETGYVEEDAKAPSSRAQHLKGLKNEIVSWAENGSPFS